MASSATSATVWLRTLQSCAPLSTSSSAKLIKPSAAEHERQGLERVERPSSAAWPTIELQRLVIRRTAEQERQHQARGTQTCAI